MNSSSEFCCDELRRAVLDGNLPLIYIAKFREFGIRILDGGSSFIQLRFCPWSGTKLPESLRDRWFDTLESLGIDPTAESIPPEFLDERWYSNNGA